MENLKEKMTCPSKTAIYRLLGEKKKGREKLLSDAGYVCAEQYARTKDDSLFERYYSREFADQEYSFDWQKEEDIRLYSFLWKRLVDYVLADAELVECYRKVATKYGRTRVPFITHSESGYHVYMIVYKVNPLSNKARKRENLPSENLFLACIKQALESDYPGCIIHQLGMLSKNDTGVSRAPALSGKDDAYHSFGEFYGENAENMDLWLERKYAEWKANICQRDCVQCRFNSLYCSVQKNAAIAVPAAVVESGKKTYTNAQLEVINHKDGAMRVSAGPGSGKTTVLVERLCKLIDSGVVPERILMVTFTKSAAREIKERVSKVCGEQMPAIGTIHSLCMNILKSVSESPVLIAGKTTRYRMIRDVLTSHERLKGANYNNMESEYGLIPTLDEVFRMFSDGESDDGVQRKQAVCANYDMSEIHALYLAYEETRQAGGYLTYDELLTEALAVLKTNDKARRLWQNQYRYIMIDEYQDVDGVQHELICLLAEKHRNLVIVGDDDQAIYKFRGGSNRYMIEFLQDFKDARDICLGDNFRSDAKIIKAADNLIRHNVNRIGKKFVAHKNLKNDSVRLYPQVDKESLIRIIDECLADGYHKSDIAIISRKNKELQKFLAEYGILSARLNRSYLYEDPVFNTINAVLCIRMNPEDTQAWLTLLVLHTDISIPDIAGSGYDAFRMLMQTDVRMQELYEKVGRITEKKISGICEQVADVFYDDPDNVAATEVSDFCLQSGAESISGACALLTSFKTVKEDIRVIYPPDERITLLTAHDSKGLEFPVVIVYGLEEFEGSRQEEVEEDRRTLYVAMTRAKERLIICQTKGVSSYYVNEILGRE